MRHVVLALVCVAAMIAYVQRTALSVPSKAIQADLELSAPALGFVMGSWFWAYALLQIPSGWLADRLGGRRSLLIYVVLWSSLVGVVGLATDLITLLLFWAMMGAAQAGLVPAMAKNVSTWYTPSQRALASGIFIASMALGGALAPKIAGQLLEWVSWRYMMLLYVIPGLVWGMFFWLLIPPRQEPRATPVDFADGVKRMVGSLPMQLLCIQMFLRAAAMAFFYTWFPRFLQETRGLTPLQSGSYAMWPGLGGMLGGLLGGIISDAVLNLTGNKRWSRQGLAVVGMVCCAGLAGTAYFVEDITFAIILISLGAFAGTAGGVSGYSVAIELGGQRPATVMSVMNMCGSFGAGLFALLVGVLVQYFQRWEPILLLFAGLFALDAVCWICLNPKRPLFDDPSTEPTREPSND